MKKKFIYGPITPKSKKASKLKFPAIVAGINGTGLPTKESLAFPCTIVGNEKQPTHLVIHNKPTKIKVPAPENN